MCSSIYAKEFVESWNALKYEPGGVSDEPRVLRVAQIGKMCHVICEYLGLAEIIKSCDTKVAFRIFNFGLTTYVYYGNSGH